MNQTYQHTAPGGWVEFSDYDSRYVSDDGTLTEDNALLQWNVALLDGMFQTSDPILIMQPLTSSVLQSNE